MRFLATVLLSIGTMTSTASAQVTYAPHTGGDPRVVAPSDGISRILPDGREILLKVGPRSTGAAYLFLGSEDLPQGTGIPRHRHEVDEEILIVHRGEVIIELNDVPDRASAGTVVYLPPRTWVALRNEAAETATIMFVFPRGSVERCFEFVGRSPGQEARRLTADEQNEEMHSCQMIYRPKN